MNEERVLSPREKEILKRFANMQALAENFSTKTRSELINCSSDAGLSPSVLNITQAFSRTSSLSDRDFFLLRDIADALKSSPALRTISTLMVNEEYIANTYKDMMSKRAQIEPDYKSPCNISRLLSLGGEAASFNNYRSYSSCDTSVFPSLNAANRMNCALKGYFPTESESVFIKKDAPIRKNRRIAGSQVAIIYTRDIDKSGMMQEFCDSAVSSFGITDAFACPTSELFVRLLSLNTGFSINADALPEINLLSTLPREYRAVIKASLSFFSDIIFGSTAVVIIASRSVIERISSIARMRGLSVCRAVSFRSPKEISITTQKVLSARLGLGLLSAIRDMIGHSAEIATHRIDAVGKDIPIEKIFEDKKGETFVYRVEVNLSRSPAPFHETLYAALGLITRAAADGFRLQSSDLSFSIGASLSLTDAKSTGAAVASILGLYRIETEFCISEKNSTVTSSDDESKLTIYLKAHSIQRATPLNEITSIEPLILADLDENGLPDLESIKKFALGVINPSIIERFEAQNQEKTRTKNDEIVNFQII